MRGHLTTYPRCIYHKPPTNRFTQWRFDRNRGRFCPACSPPSRLTINEILDRAEKLADIFESDDWGPNEH